MAEVKRYAEMTVKELLAEAKVLNISGRWDMTKMQLIEAIVRAKSENANVGGITRVQSATDETAIDNDEVNVEIETKRENSVSINREQKQKYLDNIQIGALVAFRVSDKKAKSAKVIKKSTKLKKLMVETSYGATSVISFEDVLWVRTGNRWPRGVYNMLKGIGDEE